MNSKEKSQIIWTRSLEHWPQDQARLKAKNLKVLHLPCIQTVKINKVHIPHTSSSHKVIVFTSERAAHFALGIASFVSLLHESRIFSFSTKAKDILKDFPVESFESIRSAENIASLLKIKIHPESHILLPGPKTRAVDLEYLLRTEGFHAQNLDLYETLPVLKVSDEEKEFYIQNLEGPVFFASPSACEAFANALSPHKNRLGKELKVLALGPTTQKFCKRYFEEVYVAGENSMESAIETLTLLNSGSTDCVVTGNPVCNISNDEQSAENNQLHIH